MDSKNHSLHFITIFFCSFLRKVGHTLNWLVKVLLLKSHVVIVLTIFGAYILVQNCMKIFVDNCVYLLMSGWIVSCCWVTFPLRWNARWCTEICHVRLLHNYPLLISHLPRQRETLYMWLWILYENDPFKRSERGVERVKERYITSTDERTKKNSTHKKKGAMKEEWIAVWFIIWTPLTCYFNVVPQ